MCKHRECKMEISMTFMDTVVEITFPYIYTEMFVNCARKIYVHTLYVNIYTFS